MTTEAARPGADGRGRRRAVSGLRSLREPFGVPIRIAAGRTLLATLFVVIPVFNPAFLKAGDERLYLGTVVVIVAAALALPSLRSRRFDWVAVGLAFGALYVLEAGLLRGDLTLGVVGNVYRPLHGVLAFAACAVFLLGADRDRWVRLFLWGGLVGCALAVVNTLVPAIDPFALSRPDIGYEARFLTSDRQEGAFVYPGNFGPYAAYVALVALVMLERKGLRALSLNLYTTAFVFGVLGMVTSGSRGAAIGFFLGALVVLVRTPRFRLPFALAIATVAVVVSVALLVAGTFAEIVESRILLADFSFEERLRSWDIGWEGLRHSVLFGGGVVPNTIDNTVIYYLGVGGVVGLALVIAMYWATLLRPTRYGDWANLPLVVAVAGVGLTQEALGTPLTSWAIAASVFLVSSAEREQELFAPKGRVARVRRGRRTPALAAAALLAVALGAAGAIAAGRVPVSETASAVAPRLEVSATVALPDLRTSAAAAATDGDARAPNEPIWLVAADARRVHATRYDFEATSIEGNEAVVGATVTADVPGRGGTLTFDVARWRSDADAGPAALRLSRSAVAVTSISPGSAIGRGAAAVPPVPDGATRAARLATWDGEEPDLFVVDAGPSGRRTSVRVYSGESGFRELLVSARSSRAPDEVSQIMIDVARITGPAPDLVTVTLSEPSDERVIEVTSGETRFRERILHVRMDLSRAEAPAYAFAPGKQGGEPVLYALPVASGDEQLAVVPLRYLPE